MRQLITAAMLLAVTAVSASAQGTNFDGTGAPCSFSQTVPLTTQLSGLTFGGNGSILNQCANFDVGNAHSGTDFAGYNATVRGVSESIVFSSVQSTFEIYVGSASSAWFTYFLNGNEESSTFMAFNPGAWTLVSYAGNYDRVDIDSDAAEMTLDDLNYRANVTATPEPASMTLFATGLFGLGAVVRRRRKQAA